MPGFPGGSDSSGSGGLCGPFDGGPARALLDMATIHVPGAAAVFSGGALEPPYALPRRPGRPGLRAVSPPRWA